MIPDSRSLPPGWSEHYDSQKGVWVYINNNVVPSRVSSVHPASLNDSTGNTPLSMAQQLYASARHGSDRSPLPQLHDHSGYYTSNAAMLSMPSPALLTMASSNAAGDNTHSAPFPVSHLYEGSMAPPNTQTRAPEQPGISFPEVPNAYRPNAQGDDGSIINIGATQRNESWYDSRPPAPNPPQVTAYKTGSAAYYNPSSSYPSTPQSQGLVPTPSIPMSYPISPPDYPNLPTSYPASQPQNNNIPHLPPNPHFHNTAVNTTTMLGKAGGVDNNVNSGAHGFLSSLAGGGNGGRGGGSTLKTVLHGVQHAIQNYRGSESHHAYDQPAHYQHQLDHIAYPPHSDNAWQAPPAQRDTYEYGSGYDNNSSQNDSSIAAEQETPGSDYHDNSSQNEPSQDYADQMLAQEIENLAATRRKLLQQAC